MQLTPKQKIITSIIDKYIEENGSSPTVREVAKIAGISPKGAQDHIEALVKKGYYVKEGHKSRSLKWAPSNEKTKASIYIHVKENVSPEGNLFDIEYKESTIVVPLLKTEDNKNTEFVGYVIQNDTLKSEGILKGDIAIIKKTDHPENGSIVAYSTSESPFLLSYYTKENSRIKLQKGKGAKPEYVVEINLIGQLVEIRRSYE